MQHISRAISSNRSELGKFALKAAFAVFAALVFCQIAAHPAFARAAAAGEFYYTQLTADEQVFYDSLLAAEDGFAIDANSSISIEAPSSAVIDVEKTVQAFFLDHPEIFWVEPSGVVFTKTAAADSNTVVYAIDPSSPYFRSGFDAEQLPAMREAFSSRIEIAALGLTGTVADKAEYLMTWLSAYNTGWREPCVGGRASSAYAALIDLPGSYDADGVAYACAYKCLLDAAGIPSAVVVDVAESQLEGLRMRAWNAVRIGGAYYAVDASWNLDPVNDANLPCFLAGSDTQVVEGALTGRTFEQTHASATTTVSGFGLMAPELASSAYADPEPVAVDARTFPDDAFRTWLSDPRNALGGCADGILTASEAANIVELDVSGLGIESLEGIGHFTGLRTLDCSDNEIQALDLSANAELVQLDCSGNSLVELDLSGASQLDGSLLDATGNMLERLVLPRAAGSAVPAAAYADQDSAEGFLAPEWHVGDESGAAPAETAALEGQTLVAVREAVRYLIEFDGAGAQGSMEPQVVAYGSDYMVPICGFEREGYRFTGWSAQIAEDDVRELRAGSTVSDLTPVDGARVVFTAMWEPIAYTVSFDPGEFDPAEGEPWPEDVEATYDAPFVLPGLEVEEADRLVGWCADAQGEGHIYVAGSDAVNLTAKQSGGVVLYAIWSDSPLPALRDHALAELDAAYAACDLSAYTADGRSKLDSAYAQGMSAIRAAATLSSVDSALGSAVQDIARVQVKSAAVDAAVDSWRADHAGILDASVARSSDMDSIVSAINSASALSDDGEVQAEVDARLASDVESLTEKREVSAAKTLRLETLKGIYDDYDLSSFDGAGAALITTAYQEGVRAIDAAATVADVETETETARLALAQAAQDSSSGKGPLIGPSTLTQRDPNSAAEQGGSSSDGSLSTSSFFLLLFLICGITSLCVVYANVRDKARVRRR